MGPRIRVVAATAVAVACVAGLGSCFGSTATTVNGNSPSATTSARPAPDASAAPTPAPASTYLPGGTAEDNRPLFDATNQQYFIQAGNVIPEGRGVIDNLVNVGFDKTAMQITQDRTAIDLPVDSLVFSVLIGDECLIGQFSALGYSTILAPKLATGSCLIGVTRTIDW